MGQIHVKPEPISSLCHNLLHTYVRSTYTTNGVDLNGVEGCSPGIKGVSGYYVS